MHNVRVSLPDVIGRGPENIILDRTRTLTLSLPDSP
jgi:hypothetical protein